MKILVLLGGTSAEQEVSLRSGRAVINALNARGHEVVGYNPADGVEGLRQFVGKVDVVFPVLHGKMGEDGVVQAELERLGLKFVGTGSAVSRLCFDKIIFKHRVQDLGHNVPPGKLVNRSEFEKSPLSAQPFVLKPNDGGSSIDTVIAKNPTSKRSEALSLFDRHSIMLLEQLIAGTEITVPVLDSQALPVIEIVPPDGEEFDYENKYNGKSQELCPPVSVSAGLQQKAQSIAADIHQRLRVRHFSRTDMIVTDDGELSVLELNTIPGLTSGSLFPKAAKVAGLSMEDLAEKLIQMASGG
jgi:D-alanine-D-alanine ligase